MARVTKIKLRNTCGNTHEYFHYRGWYCEVNDVQVYHVSYNLKSGANFDNADEDEYFNVGKGVIDTPEKMRKEVDEHCAYLKAEYKSLHRAFLVYRNPRLAD